MKRSRILPSRRELAVRVKQLEDDRAQLLTLEEAEAAARYVAQLALVHAQDTSAEALTPTMTQAARDRSLGRVGFAVVLDAWRKLARESGATLLRAVMNDLRPGPRGG